MKDQYKYWAFISYKREDEKWAKWLQKKLEYYRSLLLYDMNTSCFMAAILEC